MATGFPLGILAHNNIRLYTNVDNHMRSDKKTINYDLRLWLFVGDPGSPGQGRSRSPGLISMHRVTLAHVAKALLGPRSPTHRHRTDRARNRDREGS
ncbi:hypothetical protein LSAT2_027562 [Lamellibrachia satsuma]|nr:hypothetical protein LSAT2_027562 [Lamellibrachia satsuma]